MPAQLRSRPMLMSGDRPLRPEWSSRIRAALTGVSHITPQIVAREASVLLPLFERQGEVMLVLTQRTDDMPTHPGQVAFPGGSRDPEDADLYATALRETEEEIGLPRTNVEELGSIGMLPTLGSTFIVSAYAGSVTPPRAWVPSVREIAGIFEISLPELRAARSVERREREGVRFTMPVFEVGPVRVWGFTAFVLARFLDLTDPVLL